MPPRPSTTACSARQPLPSGDGDTLAHTAQHDAADLGRPPSGWRRRLYEVIFESDTLAGRAFDKVIIGPEHGFTDILTSVCRAITTITTVGFGDITPKTSVGRLIASVMRLIGWGTLALPTGIVTAEMTVRRHGLGFFPPRACPACGAGGYGPEPPRR